MVRLFKQKYTKTDKSGRRTTRETKAYGYVRTLFNRRIHTPGISLGA